MLLAIEKKNQRSEKMYSRRLVIVSLMLFLLFQLISSLTALAFDFKVTHPALTKKAISVDKADHVGDNTFKNAMNDFSKHIVNGSIDEDYPDNLRRIPNTTPGLGSSIPALNHYYNPMFGDWGYSPFNVSAPETAQDLFYQAVSYYQSNIKRKGCCYLV